LVGKKKAEANFMGKTIKLTAGTEMYDIAVPIPPELIDLNKLIN